MNNNSTLPNLVLASSSPYRRELLARLQIPFTCESPEIDESIVQDETAEYLVTRLATEKARKTGSNHPGAIIIGSDQVVVLNNEILNKPGNHENALIQLQKLSNQTVTFYTGLCVLNSRRNSIHAECIPYIVKFRKLDTGEIERYLKKEKPYNCAGSFKSEALGISLIDYMKGDDPTALIGLPLIRLCELLRNEGISIP